MSSLQKFHRRTNNAVAVPSGPFPTIGSGDATKGFWLGTAGDGTSKLIIAPLSTEKRVAWGSNGTTRNTVSTTNGLANTNTLVSFGTVAHPAAGACKYLTTGGYNTWYLPAINELTTIFSNSSATPFATANAFSVSFATSSTEDSATNAWYWYPAGGYQFSIAKDGNWFVRAVRRSLI